MFLQSIQGLPVTGTEAAVQGFLENLIGTTNMWTIGEPITLCVSLKR